MKPHLADKSLIDYLKAYYELNVAQLTFLPIGADMNASVYQATTKKQTSYFIKLKHGHPHDINISILELFDEAHLSQIILPIKTTNGRSSQHVGDFTLTVYPFIEGKNGFNRSLNEQQCVLLGKVLRQIHDIDVPTPLKARIRQETYSPKWRQCVRALFTRLQQAPPTDDKIAMKFWNFIEKNDTIIHQIVNQAEYFVRRVQHKSSKFVLCHSDIHGGNILIDKDNQIYIVDWDDPIMAPKERDLMFIGGGVGNVWNKPHEEALFYQGYGKTEINHEILAYYRYERIVEDIADFAQSLLSLTIKERDKQQLYKYFIDMFEPQGMVDIAFKTAQNSNVYSTP
jgi:spectinomycin phosphotransferase